MSKLTLGNMIILIKKIVKNLVSYGKYLITYNFVKRCIAYKHSNLSGFKQKINNLNYKTTL